MQLILTSLHFMELLKFSVPLLDIFLLLFYTKVSRVGPTVVQNIQP